VNTKRFAHPLFRILAASFFFSGAGLFAVLWGVDPETSGVAADVLFYGLLFGTVFSLVVFVGAVMDAEERHRYVIQRLFVAHARQGVLIGGVVVGSFLLQQLRSFNWFTAISIFIGAMVIEGIFLAIDQIHDR